MSACEGCNKITSCCTESLKDLLAKQPAPPYLADLMVISPKPELWQPQTSKWLKTNLISFLSPHSGRCRLQGPCRRQPELCRCRIGQRAQRLATRGCSENIIAAMRSLLGVKNTAKVGKGKKPTSGLGPKKRDRDVTGKL